MTLVVEDGSGLSNSNSYVSEAEADAYQSIRGNTAWTGQTSQDKEKHLLLAMDYMLKKFRGNWRGTKASSDQALDWPRYDVIDTDGYLIASNVVPQDVKSAQIELADRSRTQTLIPDVSGANSGSLRSETVKAGSLERTRSWYGGKTTMPSFPSVDMLVKTLVSDGSALIRD